jgi:hypothetical protein
MVEAPPLVFADGAICYLARGGLLSAMEPDQSLKWYAPVFAGGNASPTVGPMGNIYIPYGSVEFAAVPGSAKLGQTPWPKFRGNPRNTGNVNDMDQP